MPHLLRIIFTLFVFAAVIAPARAQDDPASFAFLHQFYAQRDYKPIWTGVQGFTSRARELPTWLEGARLHGLDPESYGLARMNTVLTDEQPDGPNAWRQAEVFWTYNLWHYASDLAGYDIDAATLENVVDGDIPDNLAALAPTGPLYKALMTRLAQLDASIENPPALAPVHFDFGRRLFRPGMTSKQVPLLRARMISFGAFEDVPVDTLLGGEDKAYIYDPQLAKAVGRFQKEYGLKSDGAIGPVTLSILNRTPQEERRQIVSNLQRLREPHRRVREARRIEVSIARYWLSAFDDGHEVLSMPVVVGQPRRQTISFRTEISGVRLNPTWTVPSTIKKEDFLPLLVSDPAKLLNKHGLKVTQAGKSVANPADVDWAQLPPRELAQVGFWRPAGDGNPLGRYRVIMENPYDIYLHDTNHKELFKTSMRAQSSGCVRVGDPQALTAYILGTKKDWSEAKTEEIVQKGHTADVVIENKIPIYLDYMTAWFNDRRQLILGSDVYDLDKPRYDVLVKNGLTTRGNAQKILTRAPDILQPELKEAQNRESALTHPTSN